MKHVEARLKTNLRIQFQHSIYRVVVNDRQIRQKFTICYSCVLNDLIPTRNYMKCGLNSSHNICRSLLFRWNA
ncbi:hypothetical protein RclHR1_05530006 [Rhizophagus clarus]|uniref:Uncharacterized protein n=1 Tax=Rhizophagus clarus TaxID=94130 RepID=A0A2Z6SFB5_9GLOM|nr:hypothetical protein RclHR1_05530006 [Rhizophagus clarus]